MQIWLPTLDPSTTCVFTPRTQGSSEQLQNYRREFDYIDNYCTHNYYRLARVTVPYLHTYSLTIKSSDFGDMSAHRTLWDWYCVIYINGVFRAALKIMVYGNPVRESGKSEQHTKFYASDLEQPQRGRTGFPSIFPVWSDFFVHSQVCPRIVPVSLLGHWGHHPVLRKCFRDATTQKNPRSENVFRSKKNPVDFFFSKNLRFRKF